MNHNEYFLTAQNHKAGVVVRLRALLCGC